MPDNTASDKAASSGGLSPLLDELKIDLAVAKKMKNSKLVKKIEREIEALKNPKPVKRSNTGKKIGKFPTKTRPDPALVASAQDMIDYVEATRIYRSASAITRYRPGTISWAREVLSEPNTYAHLTSDKQAEIVKEAMLKLGLHRSEQLQTDGKFPKAELMRVKEGWVRLADYVMLPPGEMIRVIIEKAQDHECNVIGREKFFLIDILEEVPDAK